MQTQVSLRRTEIREVLSRHPGCKGRIAAALGIAPQNISKWLKGQTTSKRIADAAQRMAQELLDQEQGQ